MKQRDRWRCVRCGAADAPLEAHHLRRGAERFHDIDNIETLCRACHRAAHRPKPCPASDAWRFLVEVMRG